jgi:hypothetical protein
MKNQLPITSPLQRARQTSVIRFWNDTRHVEAEAGLAAHAVP